MRRVAAIAAVVFGLSSASASADIHGYPNFTGTCELSGEQTFSAPIGGPTLTTLAANGTGTCTGTLAYGSAAVAVGTLPARANVTATGADSCLLGALPAGRFTLEMLDANGQPLSYLGHSLTITGSADVAAAATEATVLLTGGRPPRYRLNTRGGMHLAYQGGEDVHAACMAGTLGAIRFTATLETGPSLRNDNRFDRLLASSRTS